MKMTSVHYEILKNSLEGINDPVVTYSKYMSEGKTEERFRWDSLFTATMGRTDSKMPERFIADTLYEYLNDDQIDTALRKIYGHAK